jgi:hypothetical protein
MRDGARSSARAYARAASVLAASRSSVAPRLSHASVKAGAVATHALERDDRLAVATESRERNAQVEAGNGIDPACSAARRRERRGRCGVILALRAPAAPARATPACSSPSSAERALDRSSASAVAPRAFAHRAASACVARVFGKWSATSASARASASSRRPAAQGLQHRREACTSGSATGHGLQPASPARRATISRSSVSRNMLHRRRVVVQHVLALRARAPGARALSRVASELDRDAHVVVEVARDQFLGSPSASASRPYGGSASACRAG